MGILFRIIIIFQLYKNTDTEINFFFSEFGKTVFFQTFLYLLLIRFLCFFMCVKIFDCLFFCSLRMFFLIFFIHLLLRSTVKVLIDIAFIIVYHVVPCLWTFIFYTTWVCTQFFTLFFGIFIRYGKRNDMGIRTCSLIFLIGIDFCPVECSRIQISCHITKYG